MNGLIVSWLAPGYLGLEDPAPSSSHIEVTFPMKQNTPHSSRLWWENMFTSTGFCISVFGEGAVVGHGSGIFFFLLHLNSK